MTEDQVIVDDDDLYDLSNVGYSPVKNIGALYGVSVIPIKTCAIRFNDLMFMHNGSTTVRLDQGTSHSVLCFLRLEGDNRTLSWTKPWWSALKGTAATSSHTVPDYTFKDEEDSWISPALLTRYQTGLSISFREELDEGHLDLLSLKDVQLGEPSLDSSLIARRHSMGEISRGSQCLILLFGSNIAENRILEFVFPPFLAQNWYRGLQSLLTGVQILKNKQTDRRINWLKEQYLHLYFDDDRCQGPTPAQAIRVRWQ
jgi:phosphatidylinositol phospholipase C epsilon